MTGRPDRRRRSELDVVAVGVAACAACCAAPILGALGVVGGATVLSFLAGGLVLAAIVAVVGALVVARRRATG